jgi:hypothetical protein
MDDSVDDAMTAQSVDPPFCLKKKNVEDVFVDDRESSQSTERLDNIYVDR